MRDNVEIMRSRTQSAWQAPREGWVLQTRVAVPSSSLERKGFGGTLPRTDWAVSDGARPRQTADQRHTFRCMCMSRLSVIRIWMARTDRPHQRLDTPGFSDY
ncbi:hypothetical protein AAFF_G00027190 [Aldrovandia affinis]|uniref:Uncharacterized protein n=1 Tax=Aldrovandia affinis TaxID=143900 RepID=A0AAD7S4J7_9TELE|nr:hypothetical protein AAFF_G00027190 [Aldrovandia affinis]